VSSTRSLAAACLLATLAAAALAEEPWMFRGSAWVCDSPEHYDMAIERERAGGDFRTLRRELAQICVFIEDSDQDDILAPFVRRLEDDGDRVKVVFMIQAERRKALLHRFVEQIQYRGWTAASKLQTRTDWLKIGIGD
jgi:hypothetical protein